MPDSLGLEGIIVEKYYSAGKAGTKDTATGILPKNAVTYRIYVDMKPGYFLQAVYGVPGHQLLIKTTTTFFNDKAGGQKTGDQIDDKMINEHALALDSWVTLGLATKSHLGILKQDDKDASIIKRKELDKADGLIAGKSFTNIIGFGLDLNFFQDSTNTASVFSSDNGSWASLRGVAGSTADNRVLIAQLTTDGKLSFELNLQLFLPATGKIQQWVARNPIGAEKKLEGLIYRSN